MNDPNSNISTIEDKDSVDSYFECITACSIGDDEVDCVTKCVEVHLKEENA